MLQAQNSVNMSGRGDENGPLVKKKKPWSEVAGGSGSSGKFPSPVIISSTKSNVKLANLLPSEARSFGKALLALVGEPRNCQNMKRGDWLFHPTDQEQQNKLLKVTEIAGHPVSCSQPMSALITSGTIQGVPLNHTDDELLSEFASQGVIRVVRCTRKDGKGVATANSRVILTFNKLQLPEKVFMSSMISYPVAQFFPAPKQCTKCWRLQHNNKDGSCQAAQACEICCRSHSNSEPCSTFCINCKSNDHKATSYSCPAYQEMRDVLRHHITFKVPIDEAKVQIGAIYTIKKPGQSSSKNSAQLFNNQQTERPRSVAGVSVEEFEKMKKELETFKQEFDVMKTTTIPMLAKDAKEAKDSAKKAADTTLSLKNQILNSLKTFDEERAKSEQRTKDALESILNLCTGGEGVIPDTVNQLAISSKLPPDSDDEDNSNNEEMESADGEGTKSFSSHLKLRSKPISRNPASTSQHRHRTKNKGTRSHRRE